VIDAFMAQTGDKANTGAGDSGLPTLKGAFSFRRGPEVAFSGAKNPKGGLFGFVGPMPVYSQPDELALMTADGKVKTWGAFCAGVGGMARTDVEDSASAQFFLMRQNFQSLDDKYTPWGRVVAGLNVVRAIAPGEPPANPDSMTRVRLASDLPAAERPDVWRVDTASAAFKAQMTAVAAAKGPEFSPCDVDVPSEVRK
jgi:peptidylprolyl isomerase